MAASRPSRTSVPDTAVREACRFLELQVEPVLEPVHEASLLDAVHAAVRAADLTILEKLPERQRRRLLGAMEDRVARPRASPPPRALVRLTSVLSGAGAPAGELAREFAPPAR